ncbi:hypothetical protein [Aerosakkonema funiforme]|uniref:hypothetical protein n=1 Tax=Aerosakkonema funiforme TaxID=1246630 RepID=UPI0035BC7B9C
MSVVEALRILASNIPKTPGNGTWDELHAYRQLQLTKLTVRLGSRNCPVVKTSTKRQTVGKLKAV